MAVIGYGHFGRLHAHKIAAASGVDLVAVADHSEEAIERAALECGVPTTRDWRTLLGQVDAVSVVVPPRSHFEVSAAFLEAGADVLVEKPITDAPETASRLIALAESNQRIVQVGHLERFSSVSRRLCEIVGTPRFIEAVRECPYHVRGTDVSVVLDMMIHDIYLALSLIDAPIAKVSAVGRRFRSPHDDIANARIEFANGTVAVLTASRLSAATARRMRIVEDDRYVEADFQERTIRVLDAGGIEASEERFEGEDPLQGQIDAFAEVLRSRGRPFVTGQEGLDALALARGIMDGVGDS